MFQTYVVQNKDRDDEKRKVHVRAHVQGVPSLIRAWATAGASRCSRGRMASGVISLGPKPVPPEQPPHIMHT